MATKNKFVTMRIDQETHEYLMTMADREKRSLANLINLILFKYIELDKEEHRFENV